MNKKVNIGPSGVSFTGLLLLTFIILKLCGVIDWSWVWVLSPLWISAILAFILIIIAAIVIHRGNKKW